MSQIHIATFIGDGAAVYLPIGFIPDYFFMADVGDDKATVFYHWFKLLEDISYTYADGVKVTEGVTDSLADGSGIESYNTTANAPTVTTWSASASPTARSGSTHGSYYRPTRTGGKGDFSAIFECIAGTTTGSSEPSWPKDPGGTVVDNDVTWQRVDDDVPMSRVGYQGIALDVAPDDSHYCCTLSVQADKVENWGDLVDWSGGVYGA